MGADIRAVGASLGKPIDWHSINWNKVSRNVRRLQVRIVKALREGKARLVRALQYILTRSFGGRALAVRRVTENKGKRTAGADKEKWDTPKSKSEGILRLRKKGYRASPLRRVHIPKSNNKKSLEMGKAQTSEYACKQGKKEVLLPERKRKRLVLLWEER